MFNGDLWKKKIPKYFEVKLWHPILKGWALNPLQKEPHVLTESEEMEKRSYPSIKSRKNLQYTNFETNKKAIFS